MASVTTRGSMKAIVAAVIPLIAALGSYTATGEVNAQEWAVAITGLITAVVVYFLPTRTLAFSPRRRLSVQLWYRW